MSDFELFQQVLDERKSPDRNVAARFYDRAVKTAALDDNGLPCFEDVCFVEIRAKDSYDVFDQPADADKIRRFPAEYQRYLAAKQQHKKGAPLEQFAFLSAAEIESLKVRGVFTVEALAELDDDKAAELGVEKERDLAMKFLAQAKGNTALADWQRKEEVYKGEIQMLKEENARLKSTLLKKKNGLKPKFRGGNNG